MPAVVGLGSVISSAVGGMTLSGLATGATIVGAGMQLIGAVTGSKTLQKIGGAMSLAGGIGQGGMALANGFKGASSSSSLLAGSNVDDVLSSSVKGSTSASDIISKSPLKGSGGSTSAMDSFNKSSAAMDFDPTSAIKSYSPEIASSLRSISDTLTRYSLPMNILGGVGEAYMMKQTIDQRDRIQDKDIQFQQNAVDRRSQMPTNTSFAPAVSFNPNAHTGLLRAQ